MELKGTCGDSVRVVAWSKEWGDGSYRRGGKFGYMNKDFLLRKVTPSALPWEGNPAIKLGCESECHCRSPESRDEIRPITRWSRVTFSYSGACSARACGAAGLMLLAAMCRLLLAEWSVSRYLAVSNPFGFGLVTCCVAWACGPACKLSQLYTSLRSFRPMRAVDTRLNLSTCGFLLVRFSLLALKMVGSLIYSVTSVLTQRDLDLHCAAFNIPAELRPKLPDRDSTIKDSPEGKIDMYTRFIKFSNYWIPLSKFLLCILEYYQINLSQLSVIGAVKVSHFEIMYRAVGGILTVDASVCPLSISWFDGTPVVKDSLPVDEVVDLPCVKLLNENRTLIRKYSETFLCLVGLSRSFVEMDVRPTLLQNNDEELGLLNFVKSADPFKAKVDERTLAENEVPLVTETEDRVISPSLQTISLIDHTIRDELNVNSGKRKKRFSYEDAYHDNVRARPAPAPGRFVVLSSESTDADIPASPQVVPLVTLDPTGANAHVATSMSGDHQSSGFGPEARVLSATPSQDSFTDYFYECQTIDSATAQNVYIPNWNVVNNDRSASLVTCRNLLDHVTPLGYWAALRNLHDATFLDVVNVNLAQHVCMRDAKIVDLNTRLEKSEADVAEVIEFCKCVSDLEATITVKVDELANLRTENVSLVEKVSALELECDGLKNQVVGEGKMREEFSLKQDAADRHFAERAYELDARIVDVLRDMDNDLYPHMLTAIAERRWVVGHGLEAGVVYGKAGRSLAQLEAYDPEVEGKYVAVVSEFEDISFPLLDELESLKDSPLASIMSALVLKDDQEMLLSEAIPSVRRSVERRGLYSPSSFALGGASSSAPPHDSSLGVADYQVSTLALTSDGGSGSQPPAIQPHDDLFDTSVLDKPSDG
nr:hypothetical protein [Tanacetum cinerariifolium]